MSTATGYDDLGVLSVNAIDADEQLFLGRSRGVSAQAAMSWTFRGRP